MSCLGFFWVFVVLFFFLIKRWAKQSPENPSEWTKSAWLWDGKLHTNHDMSGNQPGQHLHPRCGIQWMGWKRIYGDCSFLYFIILYFIILYFIRSPESKAIRRETVIWVFFPPICCKMVKVEWLSCHFINPVNKINQHFITKDLWILI